MIEVKLTRTADPYEFDVTVREGGTESNHHVTMAESTYRKLSGEKVDKVDPERVIQAAFEFLLDREPKESILSSFDLTVICKYFPSFEQDFTNYV